MIFSSLFLVSVVPDLIILPSPKSPPPDDGYSTGSQNTPSSATLYSPRSFIVSKQQQENSNKNKFFKASKKFNLGASSSSSQKSKKSSLSPSQIKKQINSATPKSLSPPSPQVDIKVDSPPQEREATEEDDRKKMDTLTKEEISDLNDLLSIFDGGEQSPTKKEETPAQNYFKSRTLGRKPKLQEEKQQQQTITKQELLERPAKGNIPRTQSQNYGRRSEGDDDTRSGEDRPRRPMGRSKTLTRPARNVYAKSLDRERVKKGMI